MNHRLRHPMVSVMKMQTVQVVSWHCVPPPKTLIHFEHGQSVPPQKGIRSSPGGYPGGNSHIAAVDGDAPKIMFNFLFS